MPWPNWAELLAAVAARVPHIRRVMLSRCAELVEGVEVALLAHHDQDRLP